MSTEHHSGPQGHPQATPAALHAHAAWLAQLRPGAIVGLTDTGRPVLARVAALDEALIHLRYHLRGKPVDVTVGRFTGVSADGLARIAPA